MSSENDWIDEAAGPIVRPYAMTGGRTRPAQTGFDVVAIVVTADTPSPLPVGLGPEHLAILDLCRHPLSVAEVASELDLPLGVVRVLLGDLLDKDLIHIRRPASVTQFPNERVLKEVIDGLRAL